MDQLGDILDAKRAHSRRLPNFKFERLDAAADSIGQRNLMSQQVQMNTLKERVETKLLPYLETLDPVSSDDD